MSSQTLVRSGGVANLTGAAPVGDNCNWKLANGTLLPPRRFLAKLGLLCPRGQLKSQPRLVRGQSGKVLTVVLGHLTCCFHSRGNKNSIPVGRWVLTYFDARRPQNFRHWLIDEDGEAYDIAAQPDDAPSSRLANCN